MIILITGVPGSGKSLRAVELAEQYIAAGRAVFSDIEGYSRSCAIPDGDWRLTSHGSVVIYDEAHRLDSQMKRHSVSFPARGLKLEEPEIVKAMSIHRHSGHDLIFVCQHPSQIDISIRRLVTQHQHLKRIGSTKRVGLVISDTLIDLPEGSELSNADKNHWKFPVKYYDYYKSASVHLIKRRIPQPVIFVFSVAVVLLLAISFVIYSFHSMKSKSSLISTSEAKNVQSDNSHLLQSLPASSSVSSPQSSDVSSVPLVLSAPATTQFSGAATLESVAAHLKQSSQISKDFPFDISACLSFKEDCRCWNKAGNLLLIDSQVCHFLLDGTVKFPRSLSIANNNIASVPPVLPAEIKK